MNLPHKTERMTGILLGAAVGDAVGLPAEGMSRSRIARLWQGPWRHRLLFGYGMFSDDTEHQAFVAQGLIRHPNDPKAFARYLGRRLRLWLLLVPAGIGFATLRAILKLMVGFPPHRSGVFSAGNGPAMRCALIGARFPQDRERRESFLAVATQITHTDPKAMTGARAVTELCAWSVLRSGPLTGADQAAVLHMFRQAGDDGEWRGLADRLGNGLEAGLDVAAFAAGLGWEKGISGYIYHSVTIAVYAWLCHFGDFRATLESVFRLGGDTDTVGAITGALAGASHGDASIPREWLDGVIDYPLSPNYLQRLGVALAQTTPQKVSQGWGVMVLPFRNLFFTVVVLLHGFRRLLPPY